MEQLLRCPVFKEWCKFFPLFRWMRCLQSSVHSHGELTPWIFREKSQPRLTRIYSATSYINLKTKLAHLLFTLCDFHRPLQVWLITFKPDCLCPVDTSSTQKCSSSRGRCHTQVPGPDNVGHSLLTAPAEALTLHRAPLCFPQPNHISHSSANLTLIKYT